MKNNNSRGSGSQQSPADACPAVHNGCEAEIGKAESRREEIAAASLDFIHDVCQCAVLGGFLVSERLMGINFIAPSERHPLTAGDFARMPVSCRIAGRETSNGNDASRTMHDAYPF